MSLTQAETVFGSVHELGIDDLFKEFFAARPRYLNYGTPVFVPLTTVNATAIPAVNFPGVPGGIQFSLQFSIPTTDIHPPTVAAPLTPGPGQFTVQTTVTMRMMCGSQRQDHPAGTAPGPISILKANLSVIALCHPIVISSAPGSGQIGIGLDQVEVVDIKPDDLETLVECLLKMILQAVLSNFRLPFNTITAGAFGLILLVGPLAEQDQIKVRGNAL